MLPVTHRKVTVIPHSLAAIAAGICLLAAFAWESPRTDLVAEADAGAPSGVVETTAEREKNGEENSGDSAREATRTGKNAAEFRLFPLLLPRNSGGG